jgi:hypothetical protein
MAWFLVAILGVVAAGLGVMLVRLRGQRRGAELGKEQAEARAAALAAQALAHMTAQHAAKARVAALEAQAGTDRSGREAAEARVAALEAQASDVRSSKEAAEARVAALEAKATDGAEPRLVALWALAQLEQQRAWRLSLAAVIEGEPDGLPRALAMEVDRIREEVGTPGSLDLRLDPPVGVDDAALALLAARELLAALVPHTQAYDMVIARDGSRLAIEVVCTGWEGPAEAADDVSRLLAAIAPAGGDLQLDTDADGRLRAVVQLRLAG